MRECSQPVYAPLSIDLRDPRVLDSRRMATAKSVSCTHLPLRWTPASIAWHRALGAGSECKSCCRESLSRDSVSSRRSFCLSVCRTLYTFGGPSLGIQPLELSRTGLSRIRISLSIPVWLRNRIRPRLKCPSWVPPEVALRARRTLAVWDSEGGAVGPSWALEGAKGTLRRQEWWHACGSADFGAIVHSFRARWASISIMRWSIDCRSVWMRHWGKWLWNLRKSEM